jgi:hypothetical protein
MNPQMRIVCGTQINERDVRIHFLQQYQVPPAYWSQALPEQFSLAPTAHLMHQQQSFAYQQQPLIQPHHPQVHQQQQLQGFVPNSYAARHNMPPHQH